MDLHHSAKRRLCWCIFCVWCFGYALGFYSTKHCASSLRAAMPVEALTSSGRAMYASHTRRKPWNIQATHSQLKTDHAMLGYAVVFVSNQP